MNRHQQYVPNHEKWIKYYETVGSSEHPQYFRSEKTSNRQGAKSLGKNGENKIIPIEKQSQKNATKQPELKVELVSPTKQVIDQASSEIRREKGIKRKLTNSQKQFVKKNRRKKYKSKHDDHQF